MNKISITAIAATLTLGVISAPAFGENVEMTGKPAAKAEAPTKNQVRGWDPTEKKTIKGAAAKWDPTEKKAIKSKASQKPSPSSGQFDQGSSGGGGLNPKCGLQCSETDAAKWDPTERTANEEEGGGAAKTQPKGLTSQSEFQKPVSKTEQKGLISPSGFNKPAGK